MLKETDAKKTRARILGITEFPYYEYDSNGNTTYCERSDGFWYKYEFDSNGNRTYGENSEGYWRKTEYDSNGNEIYWEDSDGYWRKIKYNGEQLESTHQTLYYPEYAKLTYTYWNDDMIIKHEHHINWLMLSFLPTLSKKIIEKYSDRLNLFVVNFFNNNI